MDGQLKLDYVMPIPRRECRFSLWVHSGSAEFLDVASYTNVVRWAQQIEERPAVQRGRRVNRPWGPEELQVIERHSASDFDT